MKIKKPYFVFDKTKKVKNFKDKFDNFKSYSLLNSDTIVVFGGDGFMLKTIKKFLKYKKPFFGLNCGTYGFLMNKNNFDFLNLRKTNLKKILINPLKIISKDKYNKIKTFYAINEISLFRQSKQIAKLNIMIGKKNIIKKLVGDGVLVSTPAGSTAYNFSANGPILNLNSGKLALTPLNPFRPRGIKSKIIVNSAKIKIKNLDVYKRPVSAVADNVEFRNINYIKVSIDLKKKIFLLFKKNSSLYNKIKLEKLKKGL